MNFDQKKRFSWLQRKDFVREIFSVLPALLFSKFLVLLAWLISKLFSGSFESAYGERFDRGLMAWDGDWYSSLVVHGYEGVLEEGVRFFPGYVIAGRFFDFLLPGSANTSLIFLANLGSLFAFLAMRKLVFLETGSEKLAAKSLWVLAVFPSSFVLTWAYAESLFLSFSIACFIALRKENWKMVALCSFVASSLRPTGLLLVVPILCTIYENWKSGQRKNFFEPMMALLSSFAGGGIFILWASIQFEETLLPLKAQESLRGSFIDPVSRLFKGIWRVATDTSATETLHIVAALLLLFLLVKLFKDWPSRYGLFASSCIAVALGAENINSLERYALNGFPILLSVLLLSNHPRLRLALPFVSSCCMVSLCVFAWLGAYVP